MPRKSKKEVLPVEVWPKVFETYAKPDINGFHIQNGPSAFNGIVRVRRYRAVFDLIDEPIEVLQARVKQLWRDTEYNGHLADPIRKVAADLGMDVQKDFTFETFGIDNPKTAKRHDY